jgi:hypothetical protein
VEFALFAFCQTLRAQEDPQATKNQSSTRPQSTESLKRVVAQDSLLAVILF